MDMVISAGKSRKNVDAYVLLPPDTKNAIDLLNGLRKDVGVRSTKKYIFARLSSDSPLTGNTDLRETVDSCPGIQFPERISSTALRKYIATVSQVCLHFQTLIFKQTGPTENFMRDHQNLKIGCFTHM
ncbi:hypothetical protein KP79_PYT19055 [Mizuhopecten yessoensis]|uniref:Uncharacterized protein n=1 Tax=Mizuhopecten yessoensis TaxID=6573 RepID=A0A210PVM3_MIZYE|nr:hypothetical protein KP79_PYT19055 [Mizuhopecten yessoensis]